MNSVKIYILIKKHILDLNEKGKVVIVWKMEWQM